MTPEDKILQARTKLLWDHPFFGALALQLPFVDASRDPRVQTMATDGFRIYYNTPWMMALTVQELVFVIAHEIMHVALLHTTRRGGRHLKKWNVACDFAINGELVETKVGTMPAGGLIDASLTGKGAEEIYALLPDLPEGGKQPGKGRSGDRGKPGKGSGAGEDDEMDPGGCGGVLDSAKAGDEAALTDAEMKIQTQVRMAVSAAKAAGKLPASLQRVIESMLEPKVDWRDVLRRFVDESTTRDFTWARPNRRLLPAGLITPGMIGDGVPHITICVDTSGSINDKALQDFAAEIRGAFEDGAVDSITVIYADADVQHVQAFEAGDILTLQAAGGGGTRFAPSLKWVQNNCPDTKAVIYLTDMYCYDFGQDPNVPVLWGVYDRDDFDKITPPFGETINISAVN